MVAAALLLATAPDRRHGRAFWGDEGTYVAMAESLAADADLVFDQRDRERALVGRFGDSPSVILHRAGERLYYSKPLIYPLLVAPAFLLAGRYAFWVVNLLALAAAAILAWRAMPEDDRRGWKLSTFLAAAAVLPYVVWSMSDLLQFALAVGAVSTAVLSIRIGRARAQVPARIRPGSGWAVGAGICLGLLVVLRLPQVLLALGVIGAVVVAGSWRRARLMAGAAVLTVLAAAAISLPLVGTINPYTATRTSFNASTGYPQDAGDPLVARQLEAKRASHRYQWSYDERTPWSALYSLIGRHTGLLPYFPLALFLIVWGVRRPSAMAALGVLALCAFYLLYRPDNYFGGSAAIGNRYFLPAYGTLFAVLAWPGRINRFGTWSWQLALLACWGIAASMGVSALISVRDVGTLDSTSQSHAAAGVFQWLPYESTLRETEGQRVRFWGGDYLRFVDYRAKVHADDFVIRGGREPAEVMLVTHREGNVFHFSAQAPAGSRLVVRPWVGSWEVITEFADGRPVEVQIPKIGPWVSHPMPFDLETEYAVHRLLFRAETAGSGDAVKLWYLGVENGE